jgi:hypothetical protein
LPKAKKPPGGSSDCIVVAKQKSLGCKFNASFDRGMGKLYGVKRI